MGIRRVPTGMGDDYVGLTIGAMLERVRDDCKGEVSTCGETVCPFVDKALDDEQTCPSSAKTFTLRNMLGQVRDALANGGAVADVSAMDECFAATRDGEGRRLGEKMSLLRERAHRSSLAEELRTHFEHGPNSLRLLDKCAGR